jgi:hypothetical protein
LKGGWRISIGSLAVSEPLDPPVAVLERGEDAKEAAAGVAEEASCQVDCYNIVQKDTEKDRVARTNLSRRLQRAFLCRKNTKKSRPDKEEKLTSILS